eukprot:scpid65799/ scgid35743/ RNA-directed DNA polymerase from mobile element jockey; Reverse transcriptase
MEHWFYTHSVTVFFIQYRISQWPDAIQEARNCDGCFSIYKIASVTLLLKAGDPCQASNYRPISLLPIVSKLLEKIVLKQLRKYIEDNPDLNILPLQQFAYRSHHSTEAALSCAINRWQCSLEERNVVGVLFLDMSKAFDRIRHDTLLDDLFRCGIGGTALSWFASYLCDRHQQVGRTIP